uniref:Ig-like domain-containing protein n=1 Tax=Labrus bergylta TaxID=56723 RepID=A0A3Q3FAK4_9LABR
YAQTHTNKYKLFNLSYASSGDHSWTWEPVTLTCVSPDIKNQRVFWYKQSAGERLKLMVTLMSYSKPLFETEFSSSLFDANVSENMSNLTILTTTQEDEGMYHCAVMESGFKISWTQSTHFGFIIMVILIVCLVISTVGNVFLLCKQKTGSSFSCHCVCKTILSSAQADAENKLNYAALNFSARKPRGRKKREFSEDSVYAQVKL